MSKLQRGSAPLLIVPIVILIALIGYFVFTRMDAVSPVQKTANTISNRVSNIMSGGSDWQFDMESASWKAFGNPPECEEPLKFPAPVDVSLASGILYPGQIRGDDYKPHGGFRFDSRDTNDIELRTITDGYISKASKYEAFGEVQVLIFFVNDCGIMIMHDHLLTLSPKLEEILENVPVGKDGDSRTTLIEPKAYFKKGEVLATEIGFKNFEGRKNIFVDFGLYDLRKTNGIQYDSAFREQNPNINEYGTHALCWFDNLFPEDEEVVRSLPAGGNEGKISDYCK